MKITEQERQALEIEKKIFAMAQKQLTKKLEDNEYTLPDQQEEKEGQFDFKKKYALLTKRYEDEVIIKSEQEIWEEA